MSSFRTDYQKNDFVEYKGEICCVDSVLRFMGLDLYTDGGTKEYHDVYMGDVKPIRITDDILKKIGFSYLDLDDFYFYSDSRLEIKYSLTKNDISIHTRTTNISKTSIFYVSDIQHCLNLADIDYVIREEHF